MMGSLNLRLLNPIEMAGRCSPLVFTEAAPPAGLSGSCPCTPLRPVIQIRRKYAVFKIDKRVLKASGFKRFEALIYKHHLDASRIAWTMLDTLVGEQANGCWVNKASCTS